jgi:hypothetical protein
VELRVVRLGGVHAVLKPIPHQQPNTKRINKTAYSDPPAGIDNKQVEENNKWMQTRMQTTTFFLDV